MKIIWCETCKDYHPDYSELEDCTHDYQCNCFTKKKELEK